MAASASSFDSVTGEFGSLAMDDGLHTDDVKLSLVAINLLLNNGFKESEEIFNKYRLEIHVVTKKTIIPSLF